MKKEKKKPLDSPEELVKKLGEHTRELMLIYESIDTTVKKMFDTFLKTLDKKQLVIATTFGCKNWEYSSLQIGVKNQNNAKIMVFITVHYSGVTKIKLISNRVPGYIKVTGCFDTAELVAKSDAVSNFLETGKFPRFITRFEE